MRDRKLIAVVFTQTYDTIVLFEYDFWTNTIHETIIDFSNGETKVQKLDWEDTLEHLSEIIEKFKKYGWAVCEWT
jgi:hypothetical protein